MMTHCPDCGCEGCSPDCPGPAERRTCPECGSTAAVRRGRLTCDHCGHGHEVGDPFDTDPESANNRRFAGR